MVYGSKSIWYIDWKIYATCPTSNYSEYTGGLAVIVDSFHWRGWLYVVNEIGEIYRVIDGGDDPHTWAFESACALKLSDVEAAERV